MTVASETLVVAPGRSERTVIAADGQSLAVPDQWELLPPGDAGLTRRVKSLGPSWTVQEMKGRKKFSRGVWAPAESIATAKAEVTSERSTETYQKRRVADAKRRDQKQTAYVSEFQQAVLQFLDFHLVHQELADRLSAAVAEHATPVGSGTVARTQRIPVQQRAESAVIAWMRHQTTGYDHMKIARVKGERREVRRELAQQSRKLLSAYRRGEAVHYANCPLAKAIGMTSPSNNHLT